MQCIRISAVWCMSCLYTYPFYQSAKKKYPEIEFIEYDYDQNEQEILKYQVGEILPVHILVSEEQELGRLIGEVEEKKLLNWIEEKRK